MFHTLWTNSSCHGYHSLEFPISWVIKFPTVILLCLFVSATPYFLGLLSLRTFHSLLRSPQAFAFSTPVSGKKWSIFHKVCEAAGNGEEWSPTKGSQWGPGLLKSVLLEIPSLAEQPTPTPVQPQHCSVSPLTLSVLTELGSPQEPGAGNSQSEWSACLWNSQSVSRNLMGFESFCLWPYNNKRSTFGW